MDRLTALFLALWVVGCADGLVGMQPGLSPSLRALRVLGCEQGLRVEFASDMEASSITPESFFVERASGNVAYDSAGRTATYTPIDPFVSGESYTAVLTNRVRAVSGEWLPGEVRWQFTCVDRSPPVLLDRAPLGEGVSTHVRPTLRFNEPLDEATLTPESIFIKGVESSLRWDAGQRTVTLMPARTLHPERTYEVTVLGRVRDLAGNPLGTDVTWAFRTRAPRGDWTARLVSPPIPQATACAANIELQLSSAVVVPTSGFASAPLVVDGAPEAQVEYRPAEHVLRVDPLLPLRPGVVLSVLATSAFVDIWGDALFDDQALIAELATVEDCEMPTVVDLPALKSTTGCDEPVAIRFSQPMELESLGGLVTLRDLEAGGWNVARAPVVEAEVRRSPDDPALVLVEPVASLEDGRSYWLSLEPGATSVAGESVRVGGAWEIRAACD